MRAPLIAIAVVSHTLGCTDPPDARRTESVTADELGTGIRDVTETYAPGTLDLGHWALTTSDLRARAIEPDGGDPGGYLYGEVSTPIPTWSTVSPRVERASGGDAVRDTVFVGNYAADDIHRLGADLRVYRAGSWTASRTVTLQLTRWDAERAGPAVTATYSLPNMPAMPQGWQRYEFALAARSPAIPAGWTVMRGDGTPGDDADWAALMQQVDIVSFGWWRPGYVYPALGLWQLGIDNVHIATW